MPIRSGRHDSDKRIVLAPVAVVLAADFRHPRAVDRAASRAGVTAPRPGRLLQHRHRKDLAAKSAIAARSHGTLIAEEHHGHVLGLGDGERSPVRFANLADGLGHHRIDFRFQGIAQFVANRGPGRRPCSRCRPVRSPPRARSCSCSWSCCFGGDFFAALPPTPCRLGLAAFVAADDLVVWVFFLAMGSSIGVRNVISSDRFPRTRNAFPRRTRSRILSDG